MELYSAFIQNFMRAKAAVEVAKHSRPDFSKLLEVSVCMFMGGRGVKRGYLNAHELGLTSPLLPSHPPLSFLLILPSPSFSPSPLLPSHPPLSFLLTLPSPSFSPSPLLPSHPPLSFLLILPSPSFSSSPLLLILPSPSFSPSPLLPSHLPLSFLLTSTLMPNISHINTSLPSLSITIHLSPVPPTHTCTPFLYSLPPPCFLATDSRQRRETQSERPPHKTGTTHPAIRPLHQGPPEVHGPLPP